MKSNTHRVWKYPSRHPFKPAIVHKRTNGILPLLLALLFLSSLSVVMAQDSAPAPASPLIQALNETKLDLNVRRERIQFKSAGPKSPLVRRRKDGRKEVAARDGR